MARTKSSKRWLQEHFADPYVKQAQQAGYRSRAVYKLLALHARDKLFRPGMTVVDLGAAPGSWSQAASQLIGKHGRIFALDILPMAPLPRVEFIQGDFNEAAVLEALLQKLAGQSVDLVMSDIAPNMSGVPEVDQPRVMYLAEIALEFAQQVLPRDGIFLTKVFQGFGFDSYLLQLRRIFKQILIRKPEASRARSAEVYLVAKGLKTTGQIAVSEDSAC